MKFFTTNFKFLLIFLVAIFGTVNSFAQVLITQPSGGQGISNDLSFLATGTPAPSPAYTAIGNIVIAETAPGDFAAGTNVTLTFDRPSTAWQFNPSVGTAVGNGPNISNVSVTSVTASRITVRYTVTGLTSGTNSITISGIQVQSTIRTLGTELFIFRQGGTGVINGLVAGTATTGTKVAPLSKVAGAASTLQVLLPGQSNAPGTTTGKSGTVTPQVAGTPFSVVVNAVDYAFNVSASAPSQSIALSSSNAYPNLPASQNLSSGTTTFTAVALNTSGTGNTITATDVTNGSIAQNISSVLTVSAGTFSKLLTVFPGETLDSGSPTGKSGTATSPIAGVNYVATVYAVDNNWNRVASSNNVTTSATGVTNSTQPAAANLTNSTTTGRTFTFVFRTVGEAPNFTATNNTDGSKLAYNQVLPAVVTGPFTKLQVLLPGEIAAPGTLTGKTGTPDQLIAGTSFIVRVRAVDAAWNLVTGVTDLVRITTNDLNATMPADLAMETDGEVEFNVSLNTAIATSTRTFTAANVTDNTKTSNTSTASSVLAGAYTKLQILLPGETAAPGTLTGKTGTPNAVNAGSAFNATVNAVDANWNRITGITDVVALSSSDLNATAATGALANGTRNNLSVTLRTPGTATVTATNTTNIGITESVSSNITVNSVFTRLQILLPGETAAPGTLTGKTGTPLAQTAGVPYVVRVRAVDNAWNLVSGITDVIRLTSTDANTTMPSDLAMEVDGEVEFSVTLITAGNRTITASNFTDGSKTANTSPTVVVAPGLYAKLLVTLPGETLAAGTATGKTGTPTAINAGATVVAAVYAVDAYWNRVVGNADVIAITTSDGSATLPANNTLAANGTRNFNITLRTPGAVTVTATNITNGGINIGTTIVNVIGGVFTRLQILLPGEIADPGSATGKTGTPSVQVAGVPFTVRVRAVDGAWNLINGISDVIRLTSTDANTTMPADLAMEADGEVEFLVTLITGGNRTITASNITDGTKTANTSPTVVVAANTFTKLQVLLPGEVAAAGTATGKTGVPTNRTSGTQFTLTVNAVDAYWNRVNVSPTVNIISSDANATLPANKALSATGTTTFNVTLRTLGLANVTASDIAAAVPAAPSSDVNVVVGAFVRLQLLLPGETAAPGTVAGKTGTPTARVAGVPFNVTVNAVDAGWNIITSVTDVVSFTASTNDVYAEVPASAALVNGTLTTSATFRVVSATANRTLRANDVTDGTKTANTSPGFAVNLGPFTRLLVLLPGETYTPAHPNGKTGTPANQGAGVPFTITVRATDAAFNAVTGITDVVQITSSDVGATLPANAALVNGLQNFSVTMNTESTSNTLTSTDITDGTKLAYTTAGIPVLSPSLSTDFFRSSVTTGVWTNSSSWESSTDGSTNWKSATLAPTTTSAGVRIRNGHTINVTTTLTIDDTIIEDGGQLVLTTGNLIIANGAAATDFVVEGLLRVNNARTVTTTGALQVAGTGRYQHYYTTGSGTIPTATWSAGSTCEIAGYTNFSGSVAGSNQTFSNFVWNTSSLTGLPTLLSGFNTTNLTVISTGSSGILHIADTGGSSNITGNYTQTAGTVRANKTSGTHNLSFGGNFAVNGGTFGLGNGIVNIAFNGVSQSISNAGVTIPFQEVTFTNGGTKTLTSGSFSVATTGTLIMGANTTLNANGNLTVLSDASNSGTIANIPSDSQINGNVTVQRFVTGGSKDPYRTYRLFSSPIHLGSNTYNLTQLTDDILITGKAVNGFYEVGNSGTSAWFYDATTTGFKVFPNTSTAIAAGKGLYLLYRGNTSNAADKVTSPYTDPENVVMDYEGVLNQHNVAVPLDYSATVSGFNLLGNPYASSISWNSLLATNSTNLASNTVSIYNPAARQYATYDGITGANGGSNIIPTGQGFFVRSNPGGGTFTFLESHKITSMPSNLLMSSPIGDVGLSLASNGKIAAAGQNTLTALPTELRTWLRKENTPFKVETVVVFKDGTSADYLAKEDSPYIRGSEVFMSSLTGDNKQMVINYMPTINASTSVKLDIDQNNATGNYALELNYTNVPSGYLVKLTDSYLQTSSIINNGTVHSFSIDKNVAASYGANRFSVSFEAPTTLPVTYSSFSVAKINDGVQVKWSTATESNNNRFEIERAGDNKVYEKLQTLIAKGSGALYSYIDKNPLLGNNYYRLVQFDNDNKRTETLPQVVNFTGTISNATEEVSIFPNPVISNVTIKFNGMLKASKQTLKIVSAAGQVILNDEISKAQLLRGHELNVGGYAAGVYIVEIYENGNRIGQVKMVKQ